MELGSGLPLVETASPIQSRAYAQNIIPFKSGQKVAWVSSVDCVFCGDRIDIK